MNAKSTVALVLLAGLAGAWYFLGDRLAPKLGIDPVHPEPPASRAAAALDALTPDAITSVTVAFPSGDPLELSRADAGSPWKMPGNWPPRAVEVNELVETLGTLRARFHPEPLGDNPDLAKYGLAPNQKPLAVTVKYRTGGAEGSHELAFGEPPVPEGETTFTRPAYVRVSTKDADGLARTEVLKLGPDVIPVVRRPAEAYRRRQLFPDVERVRIAGAATPFGPPGADAPVTIALPGPNVASVTVERPVPKFLNFDLSALGSFTLARVGKLPEPAVLTRGGEAALRADRLADGWRLAAPAPDNADPARLRPVLAAVSDMWVDQFVPTAEAGFALDSKYAVALLMPVPFESQLALVARAHPEAKFLDPLRGKVALDDRAVFPPDARRVRLTPTGGEPVEVRFGGIARVGERDEPISIPGQPGMPPRTISQKVPVEYRYARVTGNPQPFVVAADKFADLFVSPEELADPRVARFESDEVWEVVIADADGRRPPIKLIRKKGHRSSTNPDEQQDRWFIDAEPNPLPADTGRVNELLSQLGGLRAESADRRTYPAAPPAARTTVSLVARENRAEGEPDAPARRITLAFGKPDFSTLRVPVYVPGQARVTLADDRSGPEPFDSWVAARLFPETLAAQLERPALAYRGRKLFDTADASLRSVSVTGGFALASDQGAWRLTAPVASPADPEKSADFARTLADLRVTEYLTGAPTADELKSFGLDVPRHAAALEFTDGRSYTLEVGAPRPGKAEVFARLDKGAVFTLPATTAESFATGALGLLPLKVWGPPSDKVTAIEVARFGDAAKEGFALRRDGAGWKLAAPFVAPVPPENADPVLAALGGLTAEKYHSLAAANPAEFGFGNPLLSVKVGYTEEKSGAEEPVTRTVIVGGTTPDGSSRYAKLDAPNAPVFVVPAGFVSAAQTAPLSLPDRTLLSLPSGDVAKLRVAVGKPEDAFTLAKDAAGKWAAEGATYGVDAERIADLVAGAARPRFTRLAAYGDAVKWADYGLDKPEATVTVTTGGEKPEAHTIALGNTDPSGARFVRIDDKPAVGVLPAAAAETLARKQFEYADRTLLTFDPTAVVSLARTKGKEELELASGGIGWDLVKPAKQKADADFVDELAAALGRLKAERVAAFGKKDEVFKQYGLDTPAALVTLAVGDKPEQKVLRLGNPVDPGKPEGERYAAVDSATPDVIVGVLPAAIANKLLSPPVAFRDRTLAKFVDADKVVIERGDRKVTFTKVGGAWKLTEPVAAAAESGELDALVAELGRLRADTWVAERGKDLKDFGLEKPEAKWTLSDGDKTVLVLLVGKKSADGRVHAVAEKGELVGLLAPKVSEQVLAEFRQRKAWDVDAAQAEAVEVSVGGAKFAFEKVGPQWFDPTKPADVIDAKVVSGLVGTLGGLQAERYAADKDADLKLFGLEKPEATLTLATPAGRKTLEVGSVVGGTDGRQRYARVADPGRTDVFVVSAADTAKLLRDRAAYVTKK